MNDLDRALSLAVRAHGGQSDKGGAPYILHPLRLVLAAATPDQRVVAALHDVLEDGRVGAGELEAAGFSREVMAAVAALTRRPEESYTAFIRRLVVDPLARRVKLLDLQDNMDILRLKELGPRDAARLERYFKARSFLMHWDRLLAGVVVGDFTESGESLGRLCARVLLIPRGRAPEGSPLTTGAAGIISLDFNNAYAEAVPLDTWKAVLRALHAADAAALYAINRFWAPFYCPECRSSYARDSWRLRSAGGEWHEVYGSCPRGHERIVER